MAAPTSQMESVLTASNKLTILPIERRNASDLSFNDFVEEYVNRNRPVIITGAVSNWPAIQKWTPEYFKVNHGAKNVAVSYGTEMKMADLVDAMEASTKEKPGPYLHRVIIHQHMPELLPDISPGNVYGFPQRYTSSLMPRQWRRPDGFLKLLMGGVGGKFPLMHFDSDNSHAMISEIYGEKEFVLFAPEDTPNVYPTPEPTSPVASVDNLDNPDLERFPLFVKATQYRGMIGPGDAAFIPSRWWHAARVVSTSISVCTNMMHRTNWPGFVEEACSPVTGRGPAIRFLKRIYLNVLGAILALTERVSTVSPEDGSANHSRL